MYLSKIFAVIGAASVFASAQAGRIQKRSMTAPQVVKNINTITSLSQDLQAPAHSINILSGPLLLIGQGPFPTIIAGFSQIVATVTQDIQEMDGIQPFSVLSDEQSILDAFIIFVTIHQQLLEILIGKAGLLNDLPFVGPPIASVLRSLEGVVDTIAFVIIDNCPDVSAPFGRQKNSLDITISNAINAYTPSI